ncbi:MAG: hypothetical protein NE328_11150 [Lentisphaeraceae bacterium]|nr:hypothetical protein [Lentisphaeraceae bacterium]
MTTSENGDISILPKNIKSIAIPLNGPLVFPSKCIYCSKNEPDHKYEYNTNVLSKIFGNITGDMYIFKIPCCRECAPKFHFKKVFPEYFMMLIVLVASLSMLLLDKNGWHTLVTFGVIPLIAILSFILIFKFQSKNKVIDIFIHKDLAIFSFKDEKMSEEFFNLNQRAIDQSLKYDGFSLNTTGRNKKSLFSKELLRMISIVILFIVVILIMLKGQN